jgi:malate dehydrogenase (oxaloacetate-decarboxylating)(NADP+)
LSLQWKRGGSEGGSCDGCRDVVRKRAAAVRVHATAPKWVEAVAMGSSTETEKKLEAGAVATETGQQEMAAAGGGVEDPYAEDRATEELPVTPWAFSVAR